MLFIRLNARKNQSEARKVKKKKKSSIAIGDMYKVSPSALTAAVKVPGCSTSNR